MHSVGQTQAFTVLGNFGTQPHVVTVDFLNDASGTTGDRNVYVNGASINGTAILGSSLTEYADGPQSFNFMAGAPAPISIGSGPDLLRFSLSEDPGATNAQVLLSVDGVQQGAPQTVTAQHAEGQTQLFNVYGTFSTASHAETVTLLASTAGTGTGQSANLYVNGVTFNGAPGAVTTATLTQAGTAGFSTPGLDTLTIGLTEDSWRGNAKAQISIDGTVLGTPTITRANAAGKPETLKYSGYFGGPYQQHSVTVNFLNDLYTTPGHDRNLYVTGINFDGTSIAGFTALMRSGPVTFIAPAATATSTSTAPSGEFAAQAVRRRQSR
jgi:hypothetical protein